MKVIEVYKEALSKKVNFDNINEILKRIKLKKLFKQEQGIVLAKESTVNEIMKKAEDIEKDDVKPLSKFNGQESSEKTVEDVAKTPITEPVYKVFIGTYTSAEQAKVAKDIIIESGSNLTPLVKCIGSNNYTLQVGIFKNKQSAEALLFTVQQNHLPGRIVAEY